MKDLGFVDDVVIKAMERERGSPFSVGVFYYARSGFWWAFYMHMMKDLFGVYSIEF